MNEAGSIPASPSGATPAKARGEPPAPAERDTPAAFLSRRQALTVLGVGAAALAAEQALVPDRPAAGAHPTPAADVGPDPGGYAPDGTAGRAGALPLADVRLLDSPFRENQARNTSYLLFLDPERMLRSFRLNYGEPSSAAPLGGWEEPASQIRGHMTGHLLSGLALTYASTGDDAVKARGRYLVSQLAALQARARRAGFHAGYLSAFPEGFFDGLEAGRAVWSPYYMIHKYLAGMIDQYQLAGNDEALDVAARLADWVDWRTGRLPYDQMQMVLQTEFGGLPEALANLYTITGQERYLAAAQRFYHAAVLDPLADGEDVLPGLQANVTTPKVIACVRMWEETGSGKYRDIARNFWDIVTGHHVYVIGGAGNYEHFQQPDTVAGQLSNFTCENCVSYNMLKLTRLLHFHEPQRADMLDYYERTLFNQMLGEQDPASPHGFNCYYTGLSAGAFKRQPLNYFPQGSPEAYATDWDTFTCDTATGLETQAKFADTIYGRDAEGLFVNLFIPSQVRYRGLVLRQAAGFPDDPVVRLSVVSGTASLALRVRVPNWVAAPASVRLNGTPLQPGAGWDGTGWDGAGAGRGGTGTAPGGWITIRRRWQPGDLLEVTLPMELAVQPAPDHPSVRALTYGPVVLSAVYASDPGPLTPQLQLASIHRAAAQPMTFEAVSGREPVKLIPIARAAHEYYTAYFQAV
ncbi:MAG: glycoside hydrolase family 127 protein [Actinobacteria bacterium]|nr:glycoside hydrolase family 127 protein [Actinomycetota bacterium]